jgi:hypothetical protein
VSNSCDWTDPLSCGASIIGGAISSSAVPAAWDAVCKSFADAAAQLLAAFGKAFAALPDVRLSTAGITGTYGISLAIAGAVAALLVFGQVIRTAWTHDGSGLAQAVTGVAKAVLAWLLTAAVATAALAAADEVTRFVVDTSFGSQQALAVRLGNIVNWASTTSLPGEEAVGASLLLVLALAGIVLVIVLWFELLLRNAAIAVLIALSPIAAAGQATETTKVWWLRTVSATVQLIILKPVIALVFAVGLGMAGTSNGIESLLAGLLVLALAAFAWPVIARFFTFTTVQASGSGLGAVLGFATGMLAGRSGGTPAGVNPAQWSMAAEGRTMAARGGAATGAAPGGQAAGAAPGAGGGGTGGAVVGGAGWALQKLHQAGAALAGQMEQTAAHAGMPGAYPYSTVSGGRIGPAQRRPGSAAPSATPPAAPGAADPGGPMAGPGSEAADPYQPPFIGGSGPQPDDFGDEEQY